MSARFLLSMVAVVGLSTLVGCDDGGCGGKGGTSSYAPYKLGMPAGRTKAANTPYNLHYLSPGEGDDDAFREYVRVDYATPPGRAHASDLPANFFLQHPDEFKDRENLTEETLQVNGRESHRMVFTYTEGERTLKVVGWFFIYKATGLVVFGVATPDSFDRFLPVFEETVRTLRLE